MTLINVQPWLLGAGDEGWAVGAFNANTLEQVQAIVQAAQDEAAPAIIQVSHRALLYAGSGDPYLGLRYLAQIGITAAQSVTVPVSLHLDHAPENEVIQALKLGFTSVMFDGGDLSLEENIKRTRALVTAARPLGANLEAELGEVPRADTPGLFNPIDSLTNPREAVEFVEQTGVDALAIALGSIHAVRSKEVILDLERLKVIRSVVKVPLVLHGSSGVRDDHIAAGIKLGLCKVNVATQLNQAFTGAVRKALAEDAEGVDPRKYLDQARQAMRMAVRERIRFFGAAGKAADWVG